MIYGKPITFSGRIKIDIANYSVLPATGKQNQIALMNAAQINDVFIQPSAPATPAEGDVWIKTGWSGNLYLQFDVAKVYLTTCRQYVSGAWTVIPEWYVYINAWTKARLYLIQSGTDVGVYPLSTRRWTHSSLDGLGGSGSTVNYTQGDSYATLQYVPSTSSNGAYGAGGICTQNFNAGQYSKICLDVYQAGRPGYLTVNEYDKSNLNTSPYAYSTISTGARRLEELAITQTDTPCCVFFGVQSYRNDGWTYGNSRIYNLYLE